MGQSRSPQEPSSQQAPSAAPERAPNEAVPQKPDAQLTTVQRSAAQPPVPPREGRRIGRRAQLVGLLLILVVMGAVAFVGQGLLTGTPSSTAAPKTVWQNITAGITDGTVPKQTALEAFAYLYRVDIPGVTVPKGIEGNDEPTSGSGAMRWVQANWAELTPDQQAVINRYLVPGPNDIALPEDTASPATSGAGGATKPEFQLMAARKTASVGVVPAPAAPITVAVALEAELVADLADLGPKLGMTILKVRFIDTDVKIHVSALDGGNTLFTTQAKVMFNGHYRPCDVTAWSNAWLGEVSSSGVISPALHVEMTHEAVHCYQNVIWGDLATGYAIPPWITEGTALYFATDDTKIEEHMLAGKWKYDYFTPETPLTNRSYDAFGYYSLLAQKGRDMWARIRMAWEAAAKGPERSNAFIAVFEGDDPDIRDNWAGSYLRQDAWGDPWKAYGFGLPADAQVSRHPAQAQAAPGWTGSLLGRSNTVLSVTASTGEVVTVSTDGLASVHDESGNSALHFQNQSFCTAASCVCPSGTLLQGKDMAPQKLTLPFVAAFNAPFGGSNYSVTADKLDDICKKPATPAPPAPAGTQAAPAGTQPTPAQPTGCGSSCSGSNGDPHLQSVNQYHYDLQAAGEFTLLRSADGSLDIQARQEPYGSGFVSINTAIAARVGSHRVGVYMTDAGLQVHLDGGVVDLTAGPKDLGGGASISAYSKGFEIGFPDGTKMWTLSVGKWGINAQISPSDSLKQSGVGVLGPIVPGGLGVPALPDGTRLPRATTDALRNGIVNGQFADAGRGTDSTTLFDYDTGKSTASYTIKPYPKDPKFGALSDLSADQTTAGNSACTTITDQDLHDECVFDVGVTGAAGFADGYKATQALYDSGIVTPTGSPQPQSSVTAPPGKVTGAVAVTQVAGVSGAVVGPDGKLYFSVGLGGGKSALLEVDPTTGTIVHQVDVPKTTTLHIAAGSVWAPGLIVDSSANNCSATRFDAQTLALQGTIPIACTSSGPTIASDGQAIWYEDDSKRDFATGKGAVLIRLDPSTNQPGTTVQLPFVGGSWLDSQGALFQYSADAGLYRLTTGSTTMEPLGKPQGRVFAAGTGFWVQNDSDQTAMYYTNANSPDATVATGGTLEAGDASAAYVEKSGQDGVSSLWRYPADGSAPTQMGAAPMVDSNALSYVFDPRPLPAANGVVKYWVIASGNATTTTLYLQWMPLH